MKILQKSATRCYSHSFSRDLEVFELISITMLIELCTINNSIERDRQNIHNQLHTNTFNCTQFISAQGWPRLEKLGDTRRHSARKEVSYDQDYLFIVRTNLLTDKISIPSYVCTIDSLQLFIILSDKIFKHVFQPHAGSTVPTKELPEIPIWAIFIGLDRLESFWNAPKLRFFMISSETFCLILDS